MSFLLLNMLAAASLAGTGVSGETRSAQALPSDQLAVASAIPAATSGHAQKPSRLADGSADQFTPGQMERKRYCERRHGHWDDRKMRCAAGWWNEAARSLIGGGTAAGAFYAIVAKNSGSSSGNSGQPSVSN